MYIIYIYIYRERERERKREGLFCFGMVSWCCHLFGFVLHYALVCFWFVLGFVCFWFVLDYIHALGGETAGQQATLNIVC